MAKKKVTRKKKINLDEKGEDKVSHKLPKKILEEENKQLISFFVIVAIIFAAFLVPYFYFESQKTFKYGGVNWDIDDEDQFITFYHAEFPALNKANPGAAPVHWREILSLPTPDGVSVALSDASDKGTTDGDWVFREIEVNPRFQSRLEGYLSC